MTSKKDNTGPARPQKQKRRPIDLLASLSVMDREAVAQWLDALIETLELRIIHVSNMIANGQEYAGAYNQVAYWRAAVAIYKELSWHCRTGRGGPLEGVSRAEARRRLKEGEQGQQ